MAEVLVGSAAVGRDLSILVSAWERPRYWCVVIFTYPTYSVTNIVNICKYYDIGVWLYLPILPILSPILQIFLILGYSCVWLYLPIRPILSPILQIFSNIMIFMCVVIFTYPTYSVTNIANICNFRILVCGYIHLSDLFCHQYCKYLQF